MEAQQLATQSIASVTPLANPITLRVAVIERLRDAIISGALQPGALLRETAIAARFGISATPVREALGALASEGLVEIEAHRLKRVAPIDLSATRDLLRVQAHLWRLGCEWGVSRLVPEDLVALEASIAAYRRALEQDDSLAAIRASHCFHTIVIAASANTELLRATLDRRSLVARFILLRGRETISPTGLRLHEAMLAAIRENNITDILARFDVLTTRMIELAAPRV